MKYLRSMQSLITILSWSWFIVYVESAGQPTEGAAWRYQVLEGSGYLDDCPPCGRPSILRPLRGSFFVSAGPSDPLFEHFELREVQLYVGGEGADGIQLTGTGELTEGGEVALVHRFTLRLKVRAPGRPEEIVDFDSGWQPGSPEWPRLAAQLQEVNPSPFRVLHLTLESMPIRELWFSTPQGFTAALLGAKPVPITAADLLSDQGRVVLSRDIIVSALSLNASVSDLNVDALEVAPGGFVQLSFATDLEPSTLGRIHQGDLIELPAKRVNSYEEFISAIGPQPVAHDLGLDAIQRMPDGTLIFSTRESAFSETLGFVVGHGDLMSTSGERFRSNQELLKAFHPLTPDHDYGLDAVYLWPSGEIWFSTTEPVELGDFYRLSDGDLLSDRGRVVYRNRELLQRFSPLEDLANFGLDALRVVTDATDTELSPPKLSVRVGSNPDELVLEWTGAGRFFQVERAVDLPGPFVAISPIIAEQGLRIPIVEGSSFLRIQQW